MLTEEKLDQMTDEEVVLLYQKEGLEMDSYFIRRFYFLVINGSRHLFIAGGDQEDLFQEGTVGLSEALDRFDETKRIKFKTFASACIMHHQMNAVEASMRKKHSPLNNYCSIYDHSAEHAALIDTLESDEYDDPEKLFLAIDNFHEIMTEIRKLLSPMENQVLELYLKGLNHKSIAKELNKDEKSIDNAIQRIRTKVKKSNIVT